MKKIDKQTIGLILLLWGIGIIVSFLATKKFWNAYDAADYWRRGCSLWNNNKFSFLNLENGFRGYVYPFYLGICNRIGGKNGFIIVNSLLNALFMVLIIPKIHQSERKSGIRCIIVYFIFNILFIGLSLYSLSDLFAIIFCSASVLLEKKLEKCNIARKSIVLSLMLGIVMYMTYNVRTIYLFADAVIVLELLIHFSKKINKGIIACSLLGGYWYGVSFISSKVYELFHAGNSEYEGSNKWTDATTGFLGITIPTL